MPIYEYMCEDCGMYEILADMAKRDEQVCPKCGKPSRRMPSRFAAHYKGPGFYTTDTRSALDACDEEIYEEVPLESEL